MRIKIIRVVIIAMFLLIALGLFYVQVIRGGFYYLLSTNNRIRIVPLEGGRGRILDRNGIVLAESRTAYNVLVAPKSSQEHAELFRYLSLLLKIPPETLQKKYESQRYAPFAPVVIAEDIARDKAIIIEENKYRFPDLIIQEGYKRTYPLGTNSSHVLGYVGKFTRGRQERSKEYGYTPQSVTGYSGVEEYYDAYIKGSEGGLQIEVNSRGQQVRLLSIKEPTKGKDIILTIDSEVQKTAQEALAGMQGVIIVMDRDNGEILGMTSVPDYDPNIFVSGDNTRKVSRLFSEPSAPLLNRAIKGLFPPGSVLKAAVAAAALESRKVTPHTTFVCRGFHSLGGRNFGCTHTHGPQNLAQSLAHSCNVYYYQIASMLGVDTLYPYLKQFGLGQLTYVDLPYEEAGSLPNRKQRLQLTRRQWFAGDTLNFAIGQGDTLTTPLQLVKMMATVANGGVEVQPHVVKSIGRTPVEQFRFKRVIHISPETLAEVQKGLRAAVTSSGGTARDLLIDQIYVAGKTGTAQTSGEKEHHAWFVGYVNSVKRNIAFCVLLEHGGSSQNACLVAKAFLLGLRQKDMI